MSAIRVYEKNEPGYALLQKFCDYLNANTTDRYQFHLEDILFDAGSGWWYTAVISEDKAEDAGMMREWQTCTPANYSIALQGEEYFNEAARDIFKVHHYMNPPSSTYDLSCVDASVGGEMDIITKWTDGKFIVKVDSQTEYENMIELADENGFTIYPAVKECDMQFPYLKIGKESGCLYAYSERTVPAQDTVMSYSDFETKYPKQDMSELEAGQESEIELD
jgi:hypothetical protein